MKVIRSALVAVILCLALASNGCLCWLTGNCDTTLNGVVSPTPADGSSNQPTEITLAWKGGDSPTGRKVTFDLYFDQTYPPGLWEPGLTEKTFIIDSLRAARTYYWRVVAREKDGASMVSPVWSFSTLFPPRSLTVDYPNWATNWSQGESRTIQWRSGYAGSQVKIDLYKSTLLMCHVTGATLNDGTYEWRLSDCADRSDPDYLIRVTSLLDSTLYDESDPFTVTLPCPIILTSPQLREEWISNEVHTIQWHPLGLGTNIKVSLHLYKGSEFVYIIAPITADNGSYDWAVNDHGAGSGVDYRVRISDLNEFNCSRFSDYFSLHACNVAVASPANGEVWPLGTTQTIIWDPSDLEETVSFELYHDGVFVCMLVDSAPNTGIYEWVVSRCESLYGADFQIRVLSGQDGACGFSSKFKLHP